LEKTQMQAGVGALLILAKRLQLVEGEAV